MMVLAIWAGRARNSYCAATRSTAADSTLGRTKAEGSWAGLEVPDSEATIEEAHAVSNAAPAVARLDMADKLDPPSQGRQSVQGRTRKCQPARARILQRLFAT